MNAKCNISSGIELERRATSVRFSANTCRLDSWWIEKRWPWLTRETK
jgi:hypothetical protein